MVVFKADGADIVMVHLFGPVPMKYNKIQDLVLILYTYLWKNISEKQNSRLKICIYYWKGACLSEWLLNDINFLRKKEERSDIISKDKQVTWFTKLQHFSNEIFSAANNWCVVLNSSLQPFWLQTRRWRSADRSGALYCTQEMKLQSSCSFSSSALSSSH